MNLFAKKPMNTPLRAMAWELLQFVIPIKNAEALIMFVICIMIGVFSIDKNPDQGIRGIFGFEGIIFICLLLFSNERLRNLSIRNCWKYTLPIRTWRYVLTQITIVIVFLELIHLVAWLVYSSFISNFAPFLQMATFLPAVFCCCFMLARVSMLSRFIGFVFTLLTLPCFVILAAPLAVAGNQAASLFWREYGWFHYLLGISLIVFSLSVSAWAAMMDRQGWQFTIQDIYNPALHRIGSRKIRPFHSSFSASVWFEFKQRGRWFIWIGLGLALMGPRISYIALCYYPPFAVLTVFIIMGRMNKNNLSFQIDSFRATLPISDKKIAYAKATAMLGSIFLGALPLVLRAYKEFPFAPIENPSMYFFFMIIGCWILFFQILVIYIITDSDDISFYQEPLFWGLVTYSIILPSSDGAIYILINIAFSIYLVFYTYISFIQALSRGLMTIKYIYYSCVAWAFTCAGFLWFTLFIFEMKASFFLLTAPALLLLTVSPVAALPLAMWHNRHR